MVARVSNGSQAPSLPAPASVVGTPGFFTDGNPATAVQATVVDEDFCNMIQEELLAIVTAAGIAPSKTDLAQVLQGLQQMLVTSGAHQEFTAAGAFSYTVPAGCYRARVRLWGPGGQGSSSTSTAPGGGGGGGGYCEAEVATTPGSAITGVVGSGATATSCGSFVANAGAAAVAASGSGVGTGGNGGTATGGTSNRTGTSGENGVIFGSAGQAGMGGAAWCGNPIFGPSGTLTTTTTGLAGQQPGSGGSGGLGGSTGGAGAGGMAQIGPC